MMFVVKDEDSDELTTQDLEDIDRVRRRFMPLDVADMLLYHRSRSDRDNDQRFFAGVSHVSHVLKLPGLI